MTLHLSHIFLTDARTFMVFLFPLPLVRGSVFFVPLFSQQPRNTPAGGIMGRKLNLHHVARTQPDVICYHGPCAMGRNLLLVLEFEAIGRTGQEFYYCSRNSHYGLVSTQGPFAVTATQCSKWAEYDPSFVTAVQRSASTRLSAFPALTMGSIAS